MVEFYTVVDKFKFLVFLLFPVFMYGQGNNALKIETDSLLKKGSYKSVIELIKQNSEDEEYKKNADLLFNLGLAYNNLNQDDEAFVNYKSALLLYEEQNDDLAAANTNLEIFTLLDSQVNLKIDAEPYFNSFYTYATQSNKIELLGQAYNNLGIQKFSNEDSEIPKRHFKKSLAYYESIDSVKNQINILSNLAVLYTIREKKFDSATYSLKKALDLADNNSLGNNDNTYHNLYNNLGNNFKKRMVLDSAIFYFKKALSQKIVKFPQNNRKIVYSNLEQTYSLYNKPDSAYVYLKKLDSIKEVIGLAEQYKNIAEIEEKYDNEKLRADNIEVDAQRLRNKILFIGSLLLLILGSITAYTMYRNLKKKQFIAEQQREIEIQKTEKLLKEQELVTIDAMITGQEKERRRLADDLHDSVGATLAAAKLQFNHIAKNRENIASLDELFTKTSTLIDDAYSEIRGMAHLKNSGLMAKNSLLPALNKLAHNVSSTSGLVVSIDDFGLDKKLDNSIEILIFRIIQELVTNIVKHANASEASVSITQHETDLNIIIEDNGIGFNPRGIFNKDGMGLSSIERRVEHLEGNMEIDSTPAKGTTIVIDIPL